MVQMSNMDKERGGMNGRHYNQAARRVRIHKVEGREGGEVVAKRA